jgi:hypothetical protein
MIEKQWKKKMKRKLEKKEMDDGRTEDDGWRWGALSTTLGGHPILKDPFSTWRNTRY